MLSAYFKNIYQRTMEEAYRVAIDNIVEALASGGKVLDCGAYNGRMYQLLSERVPLSKENYFGIEWDKKTAEIGQQKGLQICCADLNKGIPMADGSVNCIFALSLLEHLLNGCFYLKECYRVLPQGGTMVLLTPNISTYFTAALILMGKMPSSGPHPDSDALNKREELFKVSSEALQGDAEQDTPVHRHLVVFSYRVLRDYLHMVGFSDVKGYGFGLYPFPNFMQPLLERIDPWHCHQMVFVVKK